MKTLIKKSLLVLMVVFIAVFTLGVSSKVKAADVVAATFEFGANGTASHVDGSNLGSSKSYTVDGYTLNLTSMSNVYGPAYDAKGNSCIKLGTSSKVGSLSFTVPEDVTSVVIAAAKYKANTSKVNVNGTAYTLTKNSNDGLYDSITVDTSSTKTVSFTTVSGGVRCMINTITFYKAEVVVDPSEHECSLCPVCNKCTVSGCPENEQCPTHSLSIKGGNYTEVEDVITLTASLTNLTGDVVWTSSNQEVASVDQSGNVTALSMGTTTITATLGDFKATQQFTVYPTDGSILTVAEAIAVCKLTGNANTPFKYKAQGTVSAVSYNTTYANYTYNLTDETGTIKVYGSKGDCELENGFVVIVNGNLINYSGNTPEFNTNTTFERVIDESLDTFLANLNSIKSYMSLAYKYSVTQQEVAAESEVIDTLNLKFTGVSATTTYASWSGKQAESDAVWAGQSAGDKNSIQMRSNNSNSGVITTASGGKVAKIIVTWHADTAAGRTLDVYGSNTAYSNPTDLYNSSKQGEKLGSIVKGTSTELEIFGDYEYIGLRSNSGAMYITEIKVVWNVESEGTVVEDAYTDVDFRIKCGVDANISTLANLPEGKTYTYGIIVKTADKEVYYNSEEHAELIQTDNNVLYTIISLGDVLTNKARLDVDFTVQAYVYVDGQYYYSDQVKTYNVVDLVKAYYAMDDYKSVVESLVTVLSTMGYTFE